MVRQHDTDSLDLEKSPSLDFESSFPYVDLSLQDGIENTNRQAMDRPPSIRPLSYRSGSFVMDHESEWRARLCVFGSFLFLVCSAGTSHISPNHSSDPLADLTNTKLQVSTAPSAQSSHTSVTINSNTTPTARLAGSSVYTYFSPVSPVFSTALFSIAMVLGS